jgi:hypothetical protein
MRERRARIDRKLDALRARTTQVKTRVREQAPWAALAVVGGTAGIVQLRRWMRQRRHRQRIQRLMTTEPYAFMRC